MKKLTDGTITWISDIWLSNLSFWDLLGTECVDFGISGMPPVLPKSGNNG